MTPKGKVTDAEIKQLFTRPGTNGMVGDINSHYAELDARSPKYPAATQQDIDDANYWEAAAREALRLEEEAKAEPRRGKCGRSKRLKQSRGQCQMYEDF